MGLTGFRTIGLGAKFRQQTCAGLFRNQGEKSINFYFIVVPLRKVLLQTLAAEAAEARRTVEGSLVPSTIPCRLPAYMYWLSGTKT